jgi:hypothetical protein
MDDVVQPSFLTPRWRRISVRAVSVLTGSALALGLAGFGLTSAADAAPVAAGTPTSSPASDPTARPAEAPLLLPAGTKTVPMASNVAAQAVAPNGQDLYALSNAAGTLTEINLHTGTVVGTPVTGLYGATDLAINAAGTYAYIPITGTGTVAQIDLHTMTLVQEIPLSTPLDQLGALAVQSTPSGDRLWVTAGAQDYVWELDVATGAKSKFVVGEQPVATALAGNNLVVTLANSFDISVLNTTTHAVAHLEDPELSTGWSATTINPNLVAISGVGITVAFNPATHVFTKPVAASYPGNLSGLSTADGGRYTVVSVGDFLQDPFPKRGTLQLINSDGFTVARITEVGYGAWSTAGGTNVVSVVQQQGTGPVSLLLIPLNELTKPATMQLSTGHGGPGTAVHGTLTGFNPADKITVTLHSSAPVVVATPTIGTNTDATFVFTVPKGTAPGQHTVTATDAWLGLTSSVTFTVQKPAPTPTHHTTPTPTHHSTPTPTHDGTTTPTHPATPAPHTDPPSGGAAGNAANATPLANTGSPTARLLVIGSALLIAGGVLLLLSRRRQTARHR